MGAENSILRSYDIGKPYKLNGRRNDCERNRSQSSSSDDGPKRKGMPNDDDAVKYSLCPAVHKEDGSNISVFVYQTAKEPRICLGSACAEKLRLLRHPHILKFIGVAESERHIRIFTEDVLPLDHCIDNLENFEIISGLHNVLEALVFLHEKGDLVHKNISWSSIFVSKHNSGWKLGAMEKVEKSSPSGIHEDVSKFAEFAISVFDSIQSNAIEERDFVQSLASDILHKDKAGTEELKMLMQDRIFRDSFLEISNFLSAITMKSESEKQHFFSELAEKVRGLNPDTVARKLLPKLLSKMILAEPSAEKFFIPHLLTYPKEQRFITHDYLPVLPEDVYREFCVPLLFKLLRSKQTHVRLVLLKYLSLFVGSIDNEALETEVLPLILLGMRDENDAIVTATLHGLACLVPVLGGTVVIGGERNKYFFDQRPNFSTSSPPTTMPVNKQSIVNKQTVTKESFSSPESRNERKQMLEKKREERRKQMEARRQEREKKKKDGIGIKLSEDTPATKPNNDNKPSPEIKPATEIVEIRRPEESEPEWEGFEAFSEASASEEDIVLDPMKPTKSAENLLSIAKESLRMTEKENYEIPRDETPPRRTSLERIPTRKPLLLGEKKSLSLSKNKVYSRTDSLSSSASKDSDSLNQADIVLNDMSKNPTEGRLKNIVKIIDKDRKIKENKKKLGEEFEFQVSVKTTNLEPDFFADMTPDLSKSKTVLIEKKGPIVSSKFEATDVSSEIPTGWDDDGWENFE